MKLSDIQLSGGLVAQGLLVEAQIDYLSKIYGKDLATHAIKTANQYGNLSVAEKLLFGYTNGVIDKISLDNVERVKDLDPHKKQIEKPEVILARSLMSKKSRWSLMKDFVNSETDSEMLSSVVDYVLNLRIYDPTGERGEYLKYIVAQLRTNNIALPEDGGRLRQTLKFFHNNKNTQQWKDLKLPTDLMGKKSSISNWRNLEEIHHKLNPEEGEAVDFTSKRQKERGIKEGYQLVAEVEVPNKYKTLYTIYKITEPEAAQFLGKGTKWCTTQLSSQAGPVGRRGNVDDPPSFTYADWHPKAGEMGEYKLMQGPKTGASAGKEGYAVTAQDTYLKHNPLYIVFRKHQMGSPEPIYACARHKKVRQRTEGNCPHCGSKLRQRMGLDGTPSDKTGKSGQIFQIGKGAHSGLEIKNVDDYALRTISSSLDYVLGKWAESDPDAPIEWIRAMRKDCRHEMYNGRPPII